MTRSMKEFAVFWGCTIPARFPFIEKATRLMFDDLGADVHELDGPHVLPRGRARQGERPRTRSTRRPRATSRIVEKAGLDVVTPCNGCYSTFKEAQSHLDARTGASASAINERLAPRGPALRRRPADRALRRVARRRHGRRRSSRSKVKKPTSGACASPSTTAATCCARSRPCAGTTRCNPTKVEDARRGARRARRRLPDQDAVLRRRARPRRRARRLARVRRRKLHDLQNNDVDALVVVCPSCFQQFDLNQAALQRANEDVNVPVLYLSELIALAYGHAPEEIGLDMHRVSRRSRSSTSGTARRPTRRALASDFDVALLDKCDALPGVQGRLPGVQGRPDVPAHRHHRRARRRASSTRCSPTASSGSASSATRARRCATRDIGMAETFRKLKELAMRRGRTARSRSPRPTRCSWRRACSASRRRRARKKLGLDAAARDAAATSLGRAARRRGDDGEEPFDGCTTQLGRFDPSARATARSRRSRSTAAAASWASATSPAR